MTYAASHIFITCYTFIIITAYKGEFTVINRVHELPEEYGVATIMKMVTDQAWLGAKDEGKECFGYVCTCTSPSGDLVDAIRLQLYAIHTLARAYKLIVRPEMTFVDVAACDYTTVHTGLARLMVACKSPLFDCRTIIAQSPDRISRMPDEYESYRDLWSRMGIQLLFHTSMPTASFGELDRYFKGSTHYDSGFTN